MVFPSKPTRRAPTSAAPAEMRLVDLEGRGKGYLAKRRFKRGEVGRCCFLYFLIGVVVFVLV